MKILGLLRVRNVAPWIQSVMDSMWFCERIIALDGNSNDGTQNILERNPRVDYIAEAPGQGFNEGRDRENLAFAARHYNPEWICCPDGDEIFLPDTWEKISPFLEDPNVHVIEQHNLNLWGSEDTVRWDGNWREQYRQRFWRFQAGTLTYEINNNCLPNEIPGRERPYAKAGKLLHYGNLLAADRRRRFERNEKENMPFPDLLTEGQLISVAEAIAAPMPA